MNDKQGKSVVSQNADVQGFLDKVARAPARRKPGEAGRLLFAMDATASREPTWDTACSLQGRMFMATADTGRLAVQLCYYRGFNEFHAGPWCENAAGLLAEMTAVRCLGGHTQLGKVLEHARKEHQQHRLNALVFVGDAIEEDADRLCHAAGQLGVLGLPLFLFQEGDNPGVGSVFRQLAELSGGAWAPFNLNSADELVELLSAVAVFATGGRAALAKLASKPAALLTRQVRR